MATVIRSGDLTAVSKRGSAIAGELVTKLPNGEFRDLKGDPLPFDKKANRGVVCSIEDCRHQFVQDLQEESLAQILTEYAEFDLSEYLAKFHYSAERNGACPWNGEFTLEDNPYQLLLDNFSQFHRFVSDGQISHKECYNYITYTNISEQHLLVVEGVNHFNDWVQMVKNGVLAAQTSDRMTGTDVSDLSPERGLAHQLASLKRILEQALSQIQLDFTRREVMESHPDGELQPDRFVRDASSE